jgi:sigma-B regulation protein RsbU (phosphoserine phosphatase)
MKFRTVVMSGMLALVMGILVATIGAVSVIVDRAARRDVDESLGRTRQVFEELQGYRQTLLKSEVRVVAEEPRLKATVATEEISHETVVGVATELRTTLGCDLFVMTDATAHLLVDVANPTAAGDDMSTIPLIAQALGQGDSSGVWIGGNKPYQMQAHRLAFGSTVIGVLAIGYLVDDRVAQTVRRQTGSSVVVLLDGKPIASALDEGAAGVAPDALASALGPLATTATGPSEIELNGKSYQVVSAPFTDYRGTSSLRYVAMQSLDQALAPGRRLTRILYVVLGAGLLTAIVLASWLARKLARPLDDLVAFTGRVAGGDLKTRATVSGPVEVQALGTSMNKMVHELEESRKQLATKERLEGEMEIANRIQTSILPRRLEVAGLKLAARMIPASEVGGDYYDVLPTEAGCWVGIGDVAGHGLTAGIVMMMIQSVVAGLVRANPKSAPREILNHVNHVLYDNIRKRLETGEHCTLSLLRFDGDDVVFAGAHEDIVICRKDGQVEQITTPGTWLGAAQDISKATVDTTIRLEHGDVMVLYTDGVTEAADAAGEMFGIDGLSKVVSAARAEPVERIRDRLVEAVEKWSKEREDDVTVLIIRRENPA